MGHRRLRTLAVIAVALATAVPLTGCETKKGAQAAPTVSASASTSSPSTTASDTSATSAAAAPTTTQARRIKKWIDLQVGDCLADVPPTDPAVVEVTVVDCSQPHMAETFVRAPIPVDAALDGTANSQCEAGFVAYTGRASAASPYTIGYLIDSDQDRTGNNPLPSTVICLLQGAQGQSLTGPANG
jgi:hypothetical protein